MCKTRTLLNKNKQGTLSSCACGNYRLSFHQLCWEFTAKEYKKLTFSVGAVQTSDWELELNCLNWYVKIPLDQAGMTRTLCCNEEEYEALSFLLKGNQRLKTIANNLSLN